MEVFQSTLKLLVVLGGTGAAIAVLLIAGYRRMHLALVMLLIAFLSCDTWYFYSTYRSVLLQFRWVILPAAGVYVLFMLKARGFKLVLDSKTLLFGLLTFTAAAAGTFVSDESMLIYYKTATLMMLTFTFVVGFRTYIWRIDEAAAAIARDYAWIAIVIIVLSIGLFVLMPEFASRAGWLRGPFKNSNFLGMTLISFSPFLFLKYMNPTRSRRSVVFMTIYGVAVVTLIMTHSRSSAGGFLISLAVVIAVTNWRFLPLLMMAAVGIMGFFWWTSDAGATSVTLEGKRNVVEDFIYKDRESLMDSRRMESQRIVLDNIKNNFWFGVGYGISPELEEGRQEEDLESGRLIKREKANSYLAIQEELGVFGSAIVLLILVPILFSGMRVLSVGATRFGSRDPDVALLAAYYASVLGLTANAAFEAWMLSVGNTITIVYWMNVMGIDYVTKRLRARLNQKPVDEQTDEASEQAADGGKPIPAVVPRRPVPVYPPPPGRSPSVPASPSNGTPSGFTY